MLLHVKERNMEYPQKYVKSIEELLGQEGAQKLFDSLENRTNQGLRINNRKISNEAFLELADKCTLSRDCSFGKIPWIPNGYYIKDTKPASAHPYYRAGLYYIQEPSAMTPARSLKIERDDKVLDMCAAPGGKATQLASMLGKKGFLLANDISAGRGRALLKNLEMAGADNFCVTAEDPGRLAKVYPEYFDKILLDAPCSGEGMFRKDPKSVAAWMEKGPEFYAPIQEKLLGDASAMLSPGGTLLYSTCTFSTKENEERILKLLEEHKELHTVKIEPYTGFEKGCMGLDDAVRIYPHRMDGEGHFCCLIRKEGYKKSSAIDQKVDRQIIKKLPDILTEFLSYVKYDFSDGCFIKDREHVYYLGSSVARIPSLRYLRTGLYIGDIKNDRFEPSQAFAMVLSKDMFEYCIDHNCDDPQLEKYLKGESFPIEGTGKKGFQWRLITVDGYSVGWAKASGNMLKNKYEASWRKN